MKQTPLHELHRALGATFTDFAGWKMPVRYTSEIEEHHAVRTTAGLFDLSHMGEIELEGPEAAAALDYALVGHASAIPVGRAKYSMLCDHDGGILDDLVVYRLAETHFLVVANATNAPVVHGVLNERAMNFDATVSNRSQDWALIALQGPAAVRILAALTDCDVVALRYYGIDSATVAGLDVLLARTGYTGEDGFEVYCRPDQAPGMWSALTEEGAQHGLVPAGLACRDTLRLEAGMPLYGQELGRGTSPFDAGLGRVIAFGTEPFAGSKALAARRDEGVSQTLVGLRSSGRRSPRTGFDVIDPATNKTIGQVTSGAPSPTLGHPIAMAYVAVASSKPGTQLAVNVRGTLESVEVVSMPFYKRSS